MRREYKLDPYTRQRSGDLASTEPTLVYLLEALAPQGLHRRQAVPGFCEALLLHGGILFHQAKQLEGDGISLEEPLCRNGVRERRVGALPRQGTGQSVFPCLFENFAEAVHQETEIAVNFVRINGENA